MIDLHSHSTCSDGRLSPAELVARAADYGVTQLALTDHDTIAGLPAAQAAGTVHGVHIVAGVEISVTWNKRTLHIVGLAFDPAADALNDGLSALQAQRAERAAVIATKLEKLGLTDALSRARALAGTGQIARPHFARLLVEDGLCKDMNQAFKRYLRPGKPGHASIEWAALDDAVRWLHQAGGIAVLAHPFGYGFSGAWRRRAVAAFADAGGDALEICTGTTDRAKEMTAAADASAHDLLGSVGSDFHAPEQFWLAMGRLRPLPRGLTPVWDDPRLATSHINDA
ncbi:PHP domain-containing protein [Salinisphaera aquimarina]|uniref:PHP domain-containing protein n=1 Tax=Salinisphaera aquimarina TaxID=2094031 RepID=A0ABV7EKY4_9GAMM